MISYLVQYKKIYDSKFKKLGKVKADGFVPDRSVRFFILEDNTRVEFDCNDMVFKLGPERDELIRKNS